MIKGRSLIYKGKSNGPRIDPWGTPCFTRPQSDSILSRGPFLIITSDIDFEDTVLITYIHYQL
jgi:hypothetical protein